MSTISYNVLLLPRAVLCFSRPRWIYSTEAQNVYMICGCECPSSGWECSTCKGSTPTHVNVSVRKWYKERTITHTGRTHQELAGEWELEELIWRMRIQEMERRKNLEDLRNLKENEDSRTWELEEHEGEWGFRNLRTWGTWRRMRIQELENLRNLKEPWMRTWGTWRRMRIMIGLACFSVHGVYSRRRYS